MPKHIPEEIKMQVMKLFLRGDKTVKEIAKIVSKNGIMVTAPTIYSWAKKDNWLGQKAVAITDKQQKIAETEGQKFARLQQEQLENYTDVTKKAYKELNTLRFDKPFDAVKALDIGIKGQREVVSGLVNLQFVQDVLSILIEEISDQDILNRIAIKMKTLVQSKEEDK